MSFTPFMIINTLAGTTDGSWNSDCRARAVARAQEILTVVSWLRQRRRPHTALITYRNFALNVEHSIRQVHLQVARRRAVSKGKSSCRGRHCAAEAQHTQRRMRNDHTESRRRLLQWRRKAVQGGVRQGGASNAKATRGGQQRTDDQVLKSRTGWYVSHWKRANNLRMARERCGALRDR